MTYKVRTPLQILLEDGKANVLNSYYLRIETKLLKDAEEAGIEFKIASQHVSRNKTYFVLELVKGGL